MVYLFNGRCIYHLGVLVLFLVDLAMSHHIFVLALLP